MQKKELVDFFRKYKTDSEIFHDLMPVRIREILLVATVFDAYTLEEDGLISEMIFSEFYQLNLFHAPRITCAYSGEEALDKLRQRPFDLVIMISRTHRLDHRELSRKMKALRPNLPILLLLNDNAEIGKVSQNTDLFQYFDHIFVWNGNSEIFLAMVKCIEDRINVFNDTQIGLVRVILLVEDSIRYYSRYLPILYQEIMKQTQRLVSEEQLDEMKKVLRRRARPKVLLASTYEEAVTLFDLYKDFLLCVISDVTYPLEGKMDEFAGVKLTKHLRTINPDLPVLLQSSALENFHTAQYLGANFINKESDNLTRDLTSFFFNHLGFGDFVFRDETQQELGRARNMQEMRRCLTTVPAASILYHASRNHFSAWLMARGEVHIAKSVFQAKVNDFASAEELRHFLITIGDTINSLRIKGKVIKFDETNIQGEHHIFRLADGSLGGKGRGIAFINSLLNTSPLLDRLPDIQIRIPLTSIIGVDEFTAFLERNRLTNIVHEVTDPEVIKRRFLLGALSPTLQERLKIYLKHVRFPLAVRSSGLLEDSLSHPLSGVYATYFLPNNHPDLMVRVGQVMEAIKLVYASVYSRSARGYFEAIGYKIEEEKMAVIIQEVVGRARGTRFYPHVSGVAQSFNYYPFSHIQPEDGVGMIALGLGKYVVGGEASFRFCPTWPDLDLDPPEHQIKSSQRHFYALDLSRPIVDLFNGDDATLLTLDLEAAEQDGVLPHLASTWDLQDQRLRPGTFGPGPRILNFPFLVKHAQLPLPTLLQEVLGVMQNAMESPVEIEFALDLEPGPQGKPIFYILQVKHLLRESEEASLDPTDLDRAGDRLFLRCGRAMGNGTVGGLTDVIWVDPRGFDKSQTTAMVEEIDALNTTMRQSGRKYILLGPGRWGTRDRWMGIPIVWPQISGAKVIVEYALPDFQVDASLGSHFFHNVTSMNIGYFSVPYGQPPDHIDWEWLRAQEVVTRTAHFTHSRLSSPARVVMDGRQGLAAIYKPG